MMDEKEKKFTIQAKLCIKGEAFFESIISDYAIPHHVSGAKDIGIDYFCEWVHDNKPSGVLFGVQVKTYSASSSSSTRPNLVGTNNKKNGLEIYEIKNRNFRINDSTLSYWRTLRIPIYLFAIHVDPKNKTTTAYYKRYTFLLTTEADNNLEYYKVSDGHEFLAYSDKVAKTRGFVRDLFVDYMRCTYKNGSISYFNPRNLGLDQFSEEDDIFEDLFGEYRQELCETYNKLGPLMKKCLDTKKAR